MYVVFGKIPSLLWNGRRNRDEKNLEHNSKFQQMIRKLLVLLLCLTAATATAKKPKSSASKKAESSAEKPKESDYDKLFKEKHTVADGMFRLHDVKGKLYFEIPDSLFGREMLLGSTISEVSDNAAATTGSKSDYPLHVVFTRNDRSVQLRTVNCENITDETGASRALAEAVKRNTADPILRNYKIEAWNRDSTAVVVNVTDLFVADVEEMSPFSKYGLYTAFELKKTFQTERSMLGEIKAFSDNVVVRSTLSYIFTLTRGRTTLVKDQPLTAVMTRSLVLLPREPYRPRITDSRMSVFPTGKVLFSEREQRAKVIYYAHRWRLEPSDMDAWKRGERVAPKKQIVFYVDDGFPEMWKKHIFEAVDQWNEPFGRIGFKNAIAAKPYPKDDPEFDPDNIKYSCIRYAPIAIANAMGPSWVDPRSGEILNASVYVYHDVMKLLNNWLFVQTAQADERVRAVTIPEEVIGDGLRYVVAHEVGHCLGYMHNMSASAVIPVDSLRSPSFTQKYGTTTSIMDYARFNYVARPGDRERGVKLTPPRFGLYDYYAVKWLYTPVPDAATAADEYAVTSKWITGAAADSVYRFGKQQFSRSIDPRSQSEDLGDDAVKASGYGIANLKYILGNMNAWIGAQDPDFSQRRTLYDEVLTQYIRYLNHVLANVGGIYFAEKMEGDPVEAYRSVPRERQREALLFCLAQLKDMKWLDNAELIRDMPLMGSPAESIMASLVSVVVAAPARVALSAALAEKEAYTPEECRRDVYEFVWASTLKGRTPDALEMMLQREYVRSLSLSAGLKYTGTGAREEKKLVSDEGLMPVPAFLGEHAARTAALTACGERCGHDPFETFSAAHRVDTAPLLGYGSPRLNYYDPRNTEAGDYAALLKLRAMLRTKSASATGEARLHYELLLRNIEKALKK